MTELSTFTTLSERLMCNQLLVTGLISCELTNANMCLEDHADIIGSISNSQCDRVLLGGFDQLHNLGNQRQNVTEINSVCLSKRFLLYLSFLKWCHSAA